MTWRVLVVEDHPLNLELVTELLREEGCEVLAATSAEAGLRLAEAEQPDLIFMDFQLPGMPGDEATRRLKANPATATIPIVALTALAMRGDDLKAREAGCDAYLAKPVHPPTLRETLWRFLPRRPGGTGPPEGK